MLVFWRHILFLNVLLKLCEVIADTVKLHMRLYRSGDLNQITRVFMKRGDLDTDPSTGSKPREGADRDVEACTSQ